MEYLILFSNPAHGQGLGDITVVPIWAVHGCMEAEMTNKRTRKDFAIRKYQQRCHAEYSASIGLPTNYRYPTENPIRPVPPVQTACGGLMIIGAYPSARFESRKSPTSGRNRLIPIADNLQPFGEEVYFDGIQVRRLESGAGLREYLLGPLGLRADECWITDLVKVFLFKPEHKNSCEDAVPGFGVIPNRGDLDEFGRRSLGWIQEEIRICKPKVIVTLGEEVARVVTQSSKPAIELLVKEPSRPESLGGRLTFLCPHPDACRRGEKWQGRMGEIVAEIKKIA